MPGGLTAPEGLEIHRALCLSRASMDVVRSLAERGHLRRAPAWPEFRESGAVAAAWGIEPGKGTGDAYAPAQRAAGALERFGFGIDRFFEAHIAGRTGALRGPGAELHLVDPPRGLWAPVVPLGVLVEVMAGITLGFRLRSESRVGVVVDGAGTTATGAWHEGLVFAASRRCPMVVLVEVDLREEGPARRGSGTHDVTDRGPGYGIGSRSVAGDQVLEVVEAVREAARAARSGEGVQLVEVRYEGGDPVPVLEATLIDAGIADREALPAVHEEAARTARACADAALEWAAGEEERGALSAVFTDTEPVSRPLWTAPGVTSAA